jgi:DNA-binding MarR family transcriptional regulator
VFSNYYDEMANVLSDPLSKRHLKELSELTLPLMWTLRQDALRAFEGLGVRPVKALLIELIARGMQHPKALAEVLDTVPSTISMMLSELESAGYIVRALDSEDKRRTLLTLTPAGDDLRRQLRERWQQTACRRVEVLSAEELAQLVAIYRKMLEAAG